METAHIFGLLLSLFILNVLVFQLFRRVLLNTGNAAMKFLMINIGKDVIWVMVWLKILESNTANFLLITLIFLLGSGILYYFVIRLLNRS